MNPKVKTALRYLVALLLIGGLFTQPSNGHTAFKKRLEAKYEHLKVKCTTCHVQDEKKTVRNEFGKLFFRKMADQNLTEQWRAFEERADKKAFEADVMVPAFDKALAEIKEMTNEADENIGELIQAGKIENLPIAEEEPEGS